MTTVLQVFQIYFPSVVAADLPRVAATERFAWATTLAMVIIALLSPVLGAIADDAGIKKKMMAVSVAIGVTATAALYFVGRGDVKLGLAVFIVGNIAVNASFVFYESFLPHIAARGRDRPRLDHRLRPRLPVGRAAPARERGVDPASRRGSACPTARRRPASRS